MPSIFPVFAQEQGHVGRHVSLAGVLGNVGQGLAVAISGTGTVTTALVVGPNSQRKWLIATVRSDSTDDAIVTFGGGDTGGLRVRPGASLQIDDSIPWTGAITFAPASGTIYLNIIEASVQ